MLSAIAVIMLASLTEIRQAIFRRFLLFQCILSCYIAKKQLFPNLTDHITVTLPEIVILSKNITVYEMFLP